MSGKTKPADKLTFVKGDPVAVSVELDDLLLEQLDGVVALMRSWPAVRELGVVVTRETAARVALTRGLASMQGSTAVKNPTKAHSAPQPEAPEEPEEPTGGLDCEYDEDGFIVPPDGWELSPNTERVPAVHVPAHAYYTSHGWDRYWGKSGPEVMYFYWSKDPALHGLSAAAGIQVQDTPWGPGHFIPHNYVPPEN
mgnify:CR=1 FL=1|tara:strand:- start:9558 stop:10145 length:588 start_codon:yes stop_codon:yes gene_type:complete